LGRGSRSFLFPLPDWRRLGTKPPQFLRRPPAELAVLSGSCGLGFAARSSSNGAESGGHPTSRPENAFEHRGKVEIGIELGTKRALKDSFRWQQMRQVFAIVACHGLVIGGDGSR
jgi:hypothetical protein